jgi:adhesin transport system outer membrane protein
MMINQPYLRRQRKIIAFLLLVAGNAVFASDSIDYSQFLEGVLKTNPSIKEQESRLRAAESYLKGAKAERLPSISVSSPNSNEFDDSGRVRLTVPVYTFGRITNQIELKSEQLRLENLKFLKQKNDVLQEASAKYISFQRESKILGVLLDGRTQLNHLYKRIERRKKKGYDSDTDVMSALSRIQQMDQKIIDQKQKIQSLLNELKILSGISIEEVMPINSDYFMIDANSDYETLVVKQNLEILISEQEYEIAKRQKRAVALNNRPQVDAFTSQAYGGSVDRPTKLRLSLTYDMKNLGFSSWNEVEGAQFSAEASKMNIESTEQRVEIEYQRVDSEIESLNKQLESQDDIIITLDETRLSFIRQYEAGRKSLMELLNIISELNQAKTSLVTLSNEQIENRMKKYAMSGALIISAENKTLPSQSELFKSF